MTQCSIPIKARRRTRLPVVTLNDALRASPEALVVVLHRSSVYSPGWRKKLERKTARVVAEVTAVVGPGRVVGVVSGVGSGKPSKGQRPLRKAITRAKSHGNDVVVIAVDLSRIVRPEAYHRAKNPDAQLTRAERAALRKLADGVTLATILDPYMSESQRHRAATKRSKCGRPRTLTPDQEQRILGVLGTPRLDRRGRVTWVTTFAQAAATVGVEVGVVQRLLDKKLPNGLTRKAHLLAESRRAPVPGGGGMAESISKLAVSKLAVSKPSSAITTTPVTPTSPRKPKLRVRSYNANDPHEVEDEWYGLSKEYTYGEFQKLVGRGQSGYQSEFATALVSHWNQHIRWQEDTDALHLRTCTDPVCDAPGCRAKRGLPPLTADERQSLWDAVAADRVRKWKSLP